MPYYFFPVKDLHFKLTLLTGHIFLTLAPTPVFYFVSNCMEKILLGPLIIVNVIKIFANLCYVMVYDSYKHHNKYPFNRNHMIET